MNLKNGQRLEDALETSPSLKPFLQEVLAKCYQRSRKLAADETGLPLNTFPQDCPFPIEEVLAIEYLPDEEG